MPITPTIIKVWVTKYALTTGIQEIDAEVYADTPSMCTHTPSAQTGTIFPNYYHGKEWHKSKNEALAEAEAMRIRAINRLKKRIAKLEKLTF